MVKKTHHSALLKEKWFWLMLGSVGYLAALYAILIGLGHAVTLVGFPLVFVPLLFRLSIRERLKIICLTALSAYIVLLIILVLNSYFPRTFLMIFELFFVLMITIPSFLIRAPLYAIFGASSSIDALLIISGSTFIVLYWLGIRRIHRFPQHSLVTMLAVVCVSIFITFIECLDLGEGIKTITELTTGDKSMREYYRVACGGSHFGCNDAALPQP